MPPESAPALEREIVSDGCGVGGEGVGVGDGVVNQGAPQTGVPVASKPVTAVPVGHVKFVNIAIAEPPAVAFCVGAVVAHPAAKARRITRGTAVARMQACDPTRTESVGWFRKFGRVIEAPGPLRQLRELRNASPPTNGSHERANLTKRPPSWVS